MSDLTLNTAAALNDRDVAPTPALLKHGLSLLFVAFAVVLGEGFVRLVSSANVTLFFVLPVVIAATSLGWGPALTATVAGVLAYDYFFTVPYFSLAIDSPADICDALLLLVIASIISAVAAQSRRRALEARQTAEQAEALRSLAHAVIESRSEREIARAAALALNRILRAPAAIFSERDGRLDLIASTGPSQIGDADEDAARVSAASRAPTRAGAYPDEDARFDFWPIAGRGGRQFVLGVDFTASGDERAAGADRFIETVGAYLAAVGPSEAISA